MKKADMYNMTITNIDNLIDTIPQSKDLEMANNFYQQTMGAAHLACLLDIIPKNEKTAIYDRAVKAFVTYKIEKGVI